MKLRLIALFIILTSIPFKKICSQDYNVMAFGAIPDGRSNSTEAIQSAIDTANLNGGGKVLVPEGIFLIGSVRLRSNVHLILEEGATLLGSAQPVDYIALQRWKALILADSASNISISGKGVIDGQGAELALRIDSLFYAGLIDSNDYNFKDKRPRADIRPQIIELVNCTGIQIKGITIRSAASWVQSYFRCEDLLIEDIKVDSDTYWNNDGIDIIDSRLVTIRNCDINASDDGICLKSYYGGYSGPPNDQIMCDSILIENCKVRSSASAIKLGTSSYRGFKNITIRNIEVYDTYRSAIAIESIHNGMVENILVENIRAKNTGNALFVRLGQASRKRNDRIGGIRNVTIRDMVVEVPKGIPDAEYEIRGPALPFFHNVFPSSIVGLENYKIENLKLQNLEITYPGGANKAYANMPLERLDEVPNDPAKYPEFSMFGELPAWGLYVRHAKGISINNVVLKARESDYRPAMVFDDVRDIKANDLKIYGNQHKEEVIFHNSDRVAIN